MSFDRSLLLTSVFCFMAASQSTINPRVIGVASVSVWCVLAGVLLAVDSAGWFAFDHDLSQSVGGVSIGIAALGLLPLAVAFRGSAGQRSSQVLAGIMLSIAIRSTLTILFAILMWKWGTAPRQTVGLWTIFWYATLLATEVVVVAHLLIASNRPHLLTDASVSPRVTEPAAR